MFCSMAQTVFQYLRSVRSSSAIEGFLPSVVCPLRCFRSRDLRSFMHSSLSVWPYRRFSQLPPPIPGPENANLSSFEIFHEVHKAKYINGGVRHVNKKGGKPLPCIGQSVLQKSQRARGFQEQTKNKGTTILAILEEVELADVRLEQASKLDSWLKESLQPWHGQVNQYDSCYVLEHLESKPPLALSFFNWVRTQPAFVTDNYVMCTIMKILAKGKHFTRLKNLLNNFSTFTGGEADEVAFNVVMKAYADAHQFDKMMKTYNQMLATGVHPTEYTFSIVIRGLLKSRRSYEAIKFFEKAKKLNCTLDQHLYGELITLYGITKQFQRAAAVLKEMTANGLLPNVVVYNRLMQAYCRESLGEEALALLEEMKLEKVIPNNITYVTLIAYFSRRNDVEKAKRLFHDAQSEGGLKLNCHIYNVMIHMYVKIGQMSEAEDLIGTMKGDRLTPDHVTYFSLLSGYAKRGMFSAAKGTLATMKKELGLVNTQSYTSLLTLCLECTSEETAACLVDCMEASGHWLHKVVLELSMFPHHVYEEESFWNGIVSELKKLTIESATLADVTIMSIVAFLAKLGLENRARRFWKEARMQGFLTRMQYADRSCWNIDLHDLHPLAVEPVLAVELSHLRTILEAGKVLDRVEIVTGWGRSREGHFNGDSIQARVSAILQQLQSPFRTIPGNGGCQSAQGQEVWIWLQSQKTRSWLAMN